MKVERLEIRRPDSYETDAGKLKGVLTVKSDTGQQSIVLSALVINRILCLLAAEVGETAKRSAAQVTKAVLDSGQEALLHENDGLLELPADTSEKV